MYIRFVCLLTQRLTVKLMSIFPRLTQFTFWPNRVQHNVLMLSDYQHKYRPCHLFHIHSRTHPNTYPSHSHPNTPTPTPSDYHSNPINTPTYLLTHTLPPPSLPHTKWLPWKPVKHKRHGQFIACGSGFTNDVYRLDSTPSDLHSQYCVWFNERQIQVRICVVWLITAINRGPACDVSSCKYGGLL